MILRRKASGGPNPYKVTFSQEEMDFHIKWARDNERFRRYDERGGTWRKGMTGQCRYGLREAATSILIGKLGESAVSKYVDRYIEPGIAPVDWSFRERGDGGTDFTIYGRKIQVKDRCKWDTKTFIRCDDVEGPGIYVFCENQQYPGNEVLILGIMENDSIKLKKQDDGKGHGDLNYKVFDLALRPHSDLIKELKSRVEGNRCDTPDQRTGWFPASSDFSQAG